MDDSRSNPQIYCIKHENGTVAPFALAEYLCCSFVFWISTL
jgi:hypothetical protein